MSFEDKQINPRTPQAFVKCPAAGGVPVQDIMCFGTQDGKPKKCPHYVGRNKDDQILCYFPHFHNFEDRKLPEDVREQAFVGRVPIKQIHGCWMYRTDNCSEEWKDSRRNVNKTKGDCNCVKP